LTPETSISHAYWGVDYHL